MKPPREKTGSAERTAAGRCMCICADDFGLYASVNAAILVLIEAGIVSATGCMVRRSAWREGARALRRVDVTRCDVGLHLDLTAPVDGGPGERSMAPLMLRSFAHVLPRAAMLRQIQAQLQGFEDAIGRPPAFVDGHRHVHQFPVVRELLLDELAGRYSGGLPWIRSTSPPLGRRGWPGKAEVIEALGGRALRQRARARGFRMNRALLGVYDFAGTSERYRRRLNSWISDSASGDVLMCHPALPPGGAAAAADTIGQARLNEYTALAGIGALLQRHEKPILLEPLSRYLDR